MYPKAELEDVEAAAPPATSGTVQDQTRKSSTLQCIVAGGKGAVMQKNAKKNQCARDVIPIPTDCHGNQCPECPLLSDSGETSEPTS
eukprot:m.330324 g.330324  ORF g.330324 m.330324 type:complete len:87 (+) comp65100_c0_seq1:1964-2224(+)